MKILPEIYLGTSKSQLAISDGKRQNFLILPYPHMHRRLRLAARGWRTVDANGKSRHRKRHQAAGRRPTTCRLASERQSEGIN